MYKLLNFFDKDYKKLEKKCKCCKKYVDRKTIIWNDIIYRNLCPICNYYCYYLASEKKKKGTWKYDSHSLFLFKESLYTKISCMSDTDLENLYNKTQQELKKKITNNKSLEAESTNSMEI